MQRINSEIIRNEEANELWRKLEDACTSIADHQTKQLSYQDLYNTAYKLLLNKYGDLVYSKLQDTIIRIFNRLVSPLINLNDEQLLIEFVKCYDEMLYFCKLISDIFLYMERNYILQKQLKTIKWICHDNFRQSCFEKDQTLANKLLQCFIIQIRNDRNQQTIEKFKLREALQIMIDINLQQVLRIQQYNQQPIAEYLLNEDFYRYFFERKLIQETNRYYKEETQLCVNQMSVEEYILFIEKRYNQEIERTTSYIPKTSIQKIIECFIKNCVTQHAQFYKNGLYEFLQNDKTEIIVKAFNLFIKSEDAFEIFVQTLQQYTCECLEELNENILEGYMKMHTKMFGLQDILLKYASSDQSYRCLKAIRNSFEQKINRDQYILFELNKYFDQLLKKETLKDEEVKIQINRGFSLFNLIQQKDEFEQIYRKFLCLRLLDQNFTSMELEKSMIHKFKLECGSVLTNKMEIMFNDLSRSNQESQEFRNQLEYKARDQVDFEIQILTSEQWPLSDPINIKIHDDFLIWQKQFEQFYFQKNKKRRLLWNYGLGFVSLRATFDQSTKKEFLCSTIQGCILLQFNNQRVITINDLIEKLEIDNNILNTELEYLLSFKLLIQTENNTLTLNTKFSNRSYKIRLQNKKPQIQMLGNKNKKIDLQIDTKEVIIDRRIYLESLIVRVLKARKQLDHKDLYKYLLKDAKSRHFQIEMPFLKECIENLIAKDYLVRQEGQLETYIYKA